jgi:hypothetical protein
MRIYVSSTYMDLRDCGQKVNNAIRCLGHEDVAMEHYVAEPESAVGKRLADITDCHSSLGAFLLGVMVTFPQNSYVYRLASALLHGCRAMARERVRDLLLPSTFYLQNITFYEWAMLGSNQRPLPYEGSKIVCWRVLELAKSLQMETFCL